MRWATASGGTVEQAQADKLCGGWIAARHEDQTMALGARSSAPWRNPNPLSGFGAGCWSLERASFRLIYPQSWQDGTAQALPADLLLFRPKMAARRQPKKASKPAAKPVSVGLRRASGQPFLSWGTEHAPIHALGGGQAAVHGFVEHLAPCPEATHEGRGSWIRRNQIEDFLRRVRPTRSGYTSAPRKDFSAHG